jgi:putative transposase
MYFNRKYGRVGPLFQGVYKAVMVSNDEQMIYLSRYIHRNPAGMTKISNLDQYRFSSYPNYLSETNNKVINTSKILELFSNNREYYKDFVEKELDVEQEIADRSVDFVYIDK